MSSESVIGSVKAHIVLYNIRQVIEIGYNQVKHFMAKTTSKDFVRRFFYFTIACLLYSLWRLVQHLVQVCFTDMFADESWMTMHEVLASLKSQTGVSVPSSGLRGALSPPNSVRTQPGEAELAISPSSPYAPWRCAVRPYSPVFVMPYGPRTRSRRHGSDRQGQVPPRCSRGCRVGRFPHGSARSRRASPTRRSHQVGSDAGPARRGRLRDLNARRTPSWQLECEYLVYSMRPARRVSRLLRSTPTR